MATALSCRDGGIYFRLDGKGSNDDGNQWDDGAGGEVREICICHGPIVYSIQTTYERQGTLLCSRRHGGTDGNFDFISLSSPLTWVSGHYSSWCWDPDLLFPDEEEEPYNFCKVIRSLKFGTADGATYGPYGREIGEPFDFRCSTGIAGFHGRDDSFHLNAIGVYVKSAAKGVIDDATLISRGASADVNSSGTLPLSSSSSKLLDEPKA
ncbi:agglutinin-like [Ananas comosus]|uniref:Agglutinin-like n=1 Tax=Ananas comosus TaxID=4615 RepID=A0A6P5GR73_ANACO|nr:agglutinin-like [Ananas comosus]